MATKKQELEELADQTCEIVANLTRIGQREKAS
jgi:hypothetical protein